MPMSEPLPRAEGSEPEWLEPGAADKVGSSRERRGEEPWDKTLLLSKNNAVLFERYMKRLRATVSEQLTKIGWGDMLGSLMGNEKALEGIASRIIKESPHLSHADHPRVVQILGELTGEAKGEDRPN